MLDDPDAADRSLPIRMDLQIDRRISIMDELGPVVDAVPRRPHRLGLLLEDILQAVEADEAGEGVPLDRIAVAGVRVGGDSGPHDTLQRIADAVDRVPERSRKARFDPERKFRNSWLDGILV